MENKKTKGSETDYGQVTVGALRRATMDPEKINKVVTRDMKNPTKCVLWNEPELVSKWTKDNFELIDTFEDQSHWWRYLLKCLECGQLYFFEFYEWIDWDKGNDPQYCKYIPVETSEEIETLKKTDVFELLKFYPRLQTDYPKQVNEPKAYWVKK